MSELGLHAAADDAPPPSSRGRNKSRETSTGIGPELTLGRHIRIIGTLEVEGDLRLEGHVEGEVHCRKLHIEPGGCIDGLAVAETVEVKGEVLGEVFADRLHLKNDCSVEADIHHCHLVLEDGAFFEGRSRRHANQQALIAQLQSGLASPIK